MEENKLQVIVRESGLEKTKAEFILEKFQDYFAIAADWEKRAKTLAVTSDDQLPIMAMAREGRLFLREKRLAIEKSRKELKEQSLREGKAIDGIANVLKGLIEPIEKYLDDQENFTKNREAHEKAEKFRLMQLRIEQEEAEKERIRKEEEEKERRRIIEENERLKERLKKEAEIKERENIEKERIRKEEERERIAAEREKQRIIDAENAKKDAERQRIEQEKRKAELELEKIKRENAAKEKARLAEIEKEKQRQIMLEKERNAAPDIDKIKFYFSEIKAIKLPDIKNQALKTSFSATINKLKYIIDGFDFGNV